MISLLQILNEIEIDKGDGPIIGTKYELLDRKLKMICINYEEDTGMYNFSNEKKDEIIARCGIHEFKELMGQKRLKRIK